MHQAAKGAAKGREHGWQIGRSSVQQPAVQRRHEQNTSSANDAEISYLCLGRQFKINFEPLMLVSYTYQS